MRKLADELIILRLLLLVAILLALILARFEHVVHRLILLDPHGLREGHVRLGRLSVETGVERLVRALAHLRLRRVFLVIAWLVIIFTCLLILLLVAAERLVLELRRPFEGGAA